MNISIDGDGNVQLVTTFDTGNTDTVDLKLRSILAAQNYNMALIGQSISQVITNYDNTTFDQFIDNWQDVLAEMGA